MGKGTDLSLKIKRVRTDFRWSLLMKPAPKVKGVKDIIDIPYGEDNEKWHLLDIHRPEKMSKALPAFVYIHGGGWSTVDKTFFHHYCRCIAQKGFIVFNIDYRLAPEHRYPAQIEDIIDAVNWVVENGEKYGADISKLIVGGDSAGAHLSATLGCLCTNKAYAKESGYEEKVKNIKISALVLLCGAFDIKSAVKVRVPAIGKYIKGLLNIHSLRDLAKTGEWVEVSPLLHITGDFPPSFVTDSYDDGLFEESVAMDKVLETSGVYHKTVFYGKKDAAFIHDFQILYFLPVYKKCMNEIVKFINEILE